MLGRPGVNPLRHTEVLQVTPELMSAVREIATATRVNAYREREQNGYVLKNTTMKLRDIKFAQGDCCRKIIKPATKAIE